MAERETKQCHRCMRAYSLGIMIVAITVGSQQAVTCCFGCEGNAAGFCTSILLKINQDKMISQ